MKLFIFILLSFCFLNSHLVYASDCFKPNPVEKDLKPNPVEKEQKQEHKKVSVASNKQVPKPIPKHVLEQAQKSVWKIKIFSIHWTGFSIEGGTGFFISPNEFVTNFHVVADLLKKNSNNFTLSQKDGHKNLKIKKVKHLSALSDLAILEIEGEVSDYLNLAKKNPQLKENLSLISYPKGNLKIINKTYDISYENEFEHMYAVKDGDYAGASGAPVLNKKGEVVGVNYSSNRNYIFAIKIIHLKNLLKQDSPSFKNPKDHLEHSMKELRQVAESGDMVAQFRLGALQEEGLGMEKDLKEAVRWYREAAEQEYPEAQFNLGFAYEKGLGVEQDLKEAAYWYREAAEQEFAPAQNNLGVLHAKGWGVKKDLKEAAYWYIQAAEQGYVVAQINLGFVYEKGRGVEKNLEEAARWYKEAAEQGYMPAQFSLVLLYVNGFLGVEKIFETARWFRKKSKALTLRIGF